MKYEITFEQSLILNFFSSKIYFVFENDEEVESFLSYIKIYDNRLSNKNFENKKDIKSAAWIYCNDWYRYQFEWMDDTEYFHDEYDMIPVKFSLVKKKQKNIQKCLAFYRLHSTLSQIWVR